MLSASPQCTLTQNLSFDTAVTSAVSDIMFKPYVAWVCPSQPCGTVRSSTCERVHVCGLLQAMKRSEQQQCIDAFNKRVGRPAPTPVQFPRPAQQAQAPAGSLTSPCVASGMRECFRAVCSSLAMHLDLHLCAHTSSSGDVCEFGLYVFTSNSICDT